MKTFLLTLCLAIAGTTLFAAGPVSGVPNQFAADVHYGPHPLQVVDVYYPQGTGLAPLVVFIHGGGFTGNDKKAFWRQEDGAVKAWLNAGFAVAAINYRFLGDGPDGVLTPLKDCARAIQFLRYHATTYRIDVNRIGCMGRSAGGGASLWLSVTEQAAPASTDPVARMSSRITVVAHITAQCTYDIFDWDPMFLEAWNIEPSKNPRLAPRLCEFYDAPTVQTALTIQKYIDIRNSVEMPRLMASYPGNTYFVENTRANKRPSTPGIAMHHPLHAKVVVDAAVAAGAEVTGNVPGIGLAVGRNENVTQYFLRAL